MADRSQYGLTNLLCRLMGYTNEQVRTASPERAAQHYGIKLEHAQFYIQQERQVRGVK